MNIATSRGIAHLLKPRLPQNLIHIYWIMFPHSFANFPANGFFICACFLPNIDMLQVALTIFFLARYSLIVQHDYSIGVYMEY